MALQKGGTNMTKEQMEVLMLGGKDVNIYLTEEGKRRLEEFLKEKSK